MIKIKMECGQTMINSINLIIGFVISDNPYINNIIDSIISWTNEYIDNNLYFINDLYFMHSVVCNKNVYISGSKTKCVRCHNRLYYAGNKNYWCNIYDNYIKKYKEKQYIIEFTQEEFDLIVSVSGCVGGASLHRMFFTYLYYSDIRKYQEYEYDKSSSIHTMSIEYIEENNIIKYNEISF